MTFRLSILFALFLSANAMANQPTINLQTENFPPYNYSVEGKNFAKGDGVAGISVEIVKEAFKRAGVPYTITLRFPWKRIYGMAENKNNYGIFSMVRSEERENSFQWVGPLAPDEWVFFAKANSDIIVNSLDDAKQFQVGGYKGDALTDYLIEEGVSVRAAAQDKSNVKKLRDGRIDLWASNNFSARALAKQEGVSFSEFKPVFTIDKVDLFLGLNKQVAPAVAAKLQKALDEMSADGTIDQTINLYIQ